LRISPGDFSGISARHVSGIVGTGGYDISMTVVTGGINLYKY